MVYQAVYLIEYGYQKEPFRYLSTNKLGFPRKESWDGNIGEHRASGIYLYQRKSRAESWHEILHYIYLNAEWRVTASRVVLRTSDYRNGSFHDETMKTVVGEVGEWLPAYRKEELVLAAMLRYEWISGVGFTYPSVNGEKGRVRLDYRDTSGNYWRLEIVPAPEENAMRIANDILQKICVYRLKMTDHKNDKELIFFETCKRGIRIGRRDTEGNLILFIPLPTYYPAPGGREARPKVTDAPPE